MDKAAVPARLLDWYDRHARDLPWRVKGGLADPYRVWLSEIMLQQTTVATVKPYFQKFLARWPTLADLAQAPLDDVLTAWAGLGYYSRARNLHACAAVLVERGGFPATAVELQQLPGVGPYTAAAIAAIAFGESATVVDGNVERVVARLFALETPLPAVKPELKRLAATLTPAERAGDYAQAMMDLGATICTPRSPKCDQCPIQKQCEAYAAGIQAELPRRVAKAAVPEKRGVAFWLVRHDGAVLLRRRPPKGLLGGMVEVPSSDWIAETDHEAALTQAPVPARWRGTGQSIRHVFTHFGLELDIVTAKADNDTTLAAPYLWATLAEMDDLALPTLMRKIVRAMAGS